MDSIPRIQLADPSSLTKVDSNVMRMCATTVLVHSVTVRHLPANVDKLNCALTITVYGSAFTTPAVFAEVESEGDELGTEVLGNSADVGAAQSSANAGPKAAVTRTFKLHFSGLNLLFPGTRRRASDSDAEVKMIENPREFPLGVQVTVHSADRNHVFGSALCKTSGEPANLSYPRGEASLSFRVYPCVDGVTVMKQLFNKQCLANTYLNCPPATAAITNGEDAAATPGADGEAQEGFSAAGDAEAAPGEEASGDAAEGEEAAGDADAAEGEAAAEDQETPVEEEEGGEEGAEDQPEEPQEENGDDASALVPAPATSMVPGRPTKEEREFNNALAALIPCYTEKQRQAAFELYQSQGGNGDSKGTLTRKQVLHFIRSHAAYADICTDDEDLLRWSLAPYITKKQEIDATATATPITAEDDKEECPAADAEEEEPQAEEEAPEEEEAEEQEAQEDEAQEEEAEEEEAQEGGEEGEEAQEGEAGEEGEEHPEAQRLDPDHLYYHPTTTAEDSKEAKGGRAAHCPPLEVNYELFSVIALKLARS